MTFEKRKHTGRRTAWTLLLLATWSARAGAQLVALEPAHLVNVTTEASQRDPDVSRAPDGDYVVVWSSGVPGSSEDDVVARRYSAAGAPLGSEFQVNTEPPGFAPYPKVAMNPSGGFLVVWHHSPGYLPGGTVLARAYNGEGLAVGPPFGIHDLSEGEQSGPDVATDPGGGYLVVWLDHVIDDVAARARRVSVAGGRIGPAFAIIGGDEALHLGVDSVGPGQFLVAWARPVDDDDFGVHFRAVHADGTLGPRRLVAPGFDEFGIEYVSMAAGGDGSVVVTWSNEIFHSNVVSTRQVSAAGEILANFPAESLYGTWVTRAPDDTWMLLGSAIASALQVRLHSPGGAPVGPTFDLEADPHITYRPAVDYDAAGNPVFVGMRLDGGETGSDIWARRFLAAGIFLDDFDSGDASAWSLVEP
jgi:hypothetical protein